MKWLRQGTWFNDETAQQMIDQEAAEAARMKQAAAEKTEALD